MPRSARLRPYWLVVGILCCITIVFAPLQYVAAYYDIGAPTGYITDTARILTQNDKDTLERELATFQTSTSHQIAVVTIDSLQGDTIDGFANSLFAHLKVGQKGIDNGVLLLIALNDKQARIEVGYGLEGALTDLQSNQILQNITFPLFKQGDYATGIINTVRAIENATGNEKVKGNVSNTYENTPVSGRSILWIVIIFIGIFANLRRTKSWWAGGIVGGILGILVFAVFSIVLAIPIFIVLGLIFDFVLSKYYKGPPGGGGGTGGWWIFPSGGGFGGGGSGGGFGGFGGGGSGGGGASGRW